ncbi:hypothetical protein A9Q76_03245 [Arcobacter sp. 31_11_sub10_T18]|nr:hypothetical protein A9Q76_03245 [Arcobacter sp. 31_11_sub10_T18]
MNELTITAKEFFTKYRSTFDKGNMKEFSTFFNEPFMSVRADGKIQSLSCNKDAELFFPLVIDMWKKEGYNSFTMSDFEVVKLGSTSMLVTFTWEMLDNNADLIRQWRQSYNLVKNYDEWKVILSTFHR